MNLELIQIHSHHRVEDLRREAQIVGWLGSRRNIGQQLAHLFFAFAQWLEPQLRGHHAAY